MTGIIQSLLMGYGAAAVATDADFEYVTLLLPGNGTNGAQNNTFLDSSTNNFTITRNGNTTQGTFSPYGDNWSNYFDGTGDYLSVPDNAAFDLGSGDFTFEAWVYTTAFDSSYNVIASQWPTSGTNAWIVRITSTYIGFVANISGTQTYDFSTTVNLNEWMHICFTRSGTTLTAYKNGVQVGATQTITGTISNGTGSVTVGVLSDLNNTTDHTGYISNLRIVKGSVVYTAAFTPPTAPLTAITNTSLLTCQSNRFIDNSTNAFAITVNGNTSVQRFSPFSPTAAYASGTIGGSGYFDGTGDYLSIADNTAWDVGSGNFTLECWFYPLASGQTISLAGNWSSTTQANRSYLLYVYTDDLAYFIGEDGSTQPFASSASTVRKNAWNHIAAVRNGTTLTVYLNGIAGTGVALNPFTFQNSNLAFTIGSSSEGQANAANGYITDTRYIKGTAQYTANFTPPTAPLTAVTNTQLLCNYINAGIIDNAMMNDLETVGNAQISTSVSKFGGSSMYFDGTGDYLVVGNMSTNPNLALGSGDFTIEYWYYPLDTNIHATLNNLNNSAGNGSLWILMNGTFGGGSKVQFGYDIGAGPANALFGTGTFTTNAWYHVAIARSGSNLRCFINGTQEGSTSTALGSGSIVSYNRNLVIGSTLDSGTYSVYNLNGYIDDFRLTKGVARYTANFTAPTAAFPTS